SVRDGNSEIYAMNVDGSGVTNLTNSPEEDAGPVFSRDGSRIVFQSKRDGNWEIYIMDPDGAHVVNLTRNPQDDVAPQFQPLS
ncbi:MAG: TolB family protein, partial [Fidelibacterota bacterium]